MSSNTTDMSAAYERVQAIGREAFAQGKAGTPLSGEPKSLHDKMTHNGTSAFMAAYQRGVTSKVDSGGQPNG